jgi:methylmalonyl-CoA/ethylmalonyl-CoA epimerase
MDKTQSQEALGMEPHVEDVPAEKSMVAFLPLGSSEIELVKPTSDDSGLRRYLEKRGPGMHHLCLEVDDLQGMLERLKTAGVQLINETPQTGSGGKLYAFVHPKSANGVLVELYQFKLCQTSSATHWPVQKCVAPLHYYNGNQYTTAPVWSVCTS